MTSPVNLNLFNLFIGKDSFAHTSHWLSEVKDLKRDDAIFCLVGNKLDLNEKRYDLNFTKIIKDKFLVMMVKI